MNMKLKKNRKYEFPKDYYRYLHYRRAVLRFAGNSVLGIFTTAAILVIIAYVSMYAGLVKYDP